MRRWTYFRYIMLMVLAVGVWLSLKGVDRQASKDG